MMSVCVVVCISNNTLFSVFDIWWSWNVRWFRFLTRINENLFVNRCQIFNISVFRVPLSTKYERFLCNVASPSNFHYCLQFCSDHLKMIDNKMFWTEIIWNLLVPYGLRPHSHIPVKCFMSMFEENVSFI